MREALQRHFDLPLPSSVIVKSYRMQRGMNEGTYASAFRINPSELSEFLSNSGYTLLDPDSGEAMIARLNANPVVQEVGSIGAPFAIYRSETNRGITRFTKTLLVNSNRSDVLFHEDFH
jgi:hypothetical protein